MLNRKRILLRSLVLMLLTIVLGMGATAAFFSEIIDTRFIIKSAGLSFSLPQGSQNNTGRDMSISADLSELDGSLVPLKKSDVLNYSFSTVYDGDTDVYMLPKLKLKISNIKTGDIIQVYRKTASGEEFLGKIVYETKNSMIKDIYLKPEYTRPGEIKAFDFILKIEGVSDIVDAPPVMIVPEISFAVTQVKGNEWIGDNAVGSQTIFESIEKGATGGSDIKGFSDIVGSNETVDQNGELIEGKRTFFVKLRPKLTEAMDDPAEITFYGISKGVEKKLASDLPGELWLCLNSSNIGTGIRYTVKNKAGTVSSPVFEFEEKNGSISCFKRK